MAEKTNGTSQRLIPVHLKLGYELHKRAKMRAIELGITLHDFGVEAFRAAVARKRKAYRDEAPS
jgi:hypothetical protein